MRAVPPSQKHQTSGVQNHRARSEAMSKDSSRLIKIYLHRLVKTLVPGDLGEEYANTVFQELLQHIEEVSDRRSYELSHVVSEVRSAIPQHVFAQVEKIIGQLLQLKDPSSVARYLILLTTLMESAKSINKDSEFDHRSLFEDNRSVPNYGHTMDSFENTNFDRFSDRRSVYSTNATEPRNLTMEDMLIPYLENQVSERDIMKCISYTMMGTTSDILPLQDGVVLIPDNVNNGLSGLLHLTLEPGLIYQELTRMIDSSKNPALSQVHVATMTFISDQLSEYVQLINDLSTRQNFTLNSVYADTYDSMVKLRFLYTLLKTTLPQQPHETLSFIHSYHDHGDMVIQTCARAMFTYTLEPFLSTLIQWIVNGELIQKNNHFFISQASQSGLENDLGIQLHPERVPSFFDLKLAKQVYTIGMTNVFMKHYCKETNWLNDFSQKTEFLLRQLKSMGNDFVNGSKFRTFVSNTYDEILNYLTFILHDKFHLMKIMNALCDYLLMTKGDFIQYIISSGTELLNEPSSSLTGHQLTRLLQEAVLQTTSRYDLNQSDNNLVLNNLDARLLAIGHGNVGWDVFTLDYRIGQPLNFLLNDQANQHKKEYLRVFNHLWKIKRLNHILGEEWVLSRRIRVKERRLRRIRLIHNFINGFIQSIEWFIFHEIVDKSQKQLRASFNKLSTAHELHITSTGSNLKVSTVVLSPNVDFLKKVNGIDGAFDKLEHGFQELTIHQVQKIHSDFLLSITRHRLMDGSNNVSRGKVSNKFYINQLTNLINIAFRFVQSEMEFSKLVAQHRSDYDQDGGEQKRMGIIYDNLLMLFNEFNGDLKVFVTDLSNDDDMGLRYLGVTLNQ